MELTEGYKESDNKLIPQDWETYDFSEIVSKYLDFRGRTPKKIGMAWGNGEIIALSANNVQMGYIDFDKEGNLCSEVLYKKWMTQGDCELGDILLTMEAPLGNVTQIPDDKKYVLSQRVILIKPKELIEKNFLRYLMQGAAFQTSLIENATGSIAHGIQRKKLDKIHVSFPKIHAEQKNIAEVLSDEDALIASLDALIAKKRDQAGGARAGEIAQLNRFMPHSRDRKILAQDIIN